MAAVARKQESGSFLKKRTKKLLQLGSVYPDGPKPDE
jgi:hypothetical protein